MEELRKNARAAVPLGAVLCVWIATLGATCMPPPPPSPSSGSLSLTVRYSAACATPADPNAPCAGGYDVPQVCWSGTHDGPLVPGAVNGPTDFNGVCAPARHDAAPGPYLSTVATGVVSAGGWTVSMRDGSGRRASCGAAVASRGQTAVTAAVNVSGGSVSCAPNP